MDGSQKTLLTRAHYFVLLFRHASIGSTVNNDKPLGGTHYDYNFP